ncbi:glycyl-radical enzyme activating protein [Propionispora hippei]|uniref:Pyruvate formate lyase activating enzyme n=1 Tax=Propionispora hippei DSM 15287 TaxID=1123003 RepID=A0A1M6NFC5_9FIRM|nr:glycyl-radical enzyme activating protein [Propionispora hippei]SHJ94359.1 pyruvate formate lyase activating enzyme [Propionispora hippei DSM 15287]
MKLLPEQVMETYDIKKIKGNLFDIRRFSTHDGAGIRTTLFLKGCPLRCVWCHNPEGLSLKPRLMYLKNQCIHCGTCTQVCKGNSITLKGGRLHIDRTATDEWEAPIDACPAACLTMDCKSYTVEELVEVGLKDAAFFRHGGGITLSGGEPLLQEDFAIALLKAFHEAGVHTAIETSLYADQRVVEKALRYLDTIYADFKVFDSQKHKELTKVTNDKIKDNIRFLLMSNKRDQVIIRTPLIPTMTAGKENVFSIAKFIANIYPEVKYELLNYNPLAQAKYSLMEMEYCFAENPRMHTENKMNEFREVAKSAGIKNFSMEV